MGELAAFFALGAAGSIGVGPGLQTLTLQLLPYVQEHGWAARSVAAVLFFHVGSALAELPPYLVAKKLGGGAAPAALIRVFRRHGFVAVFAASCWPNPFIDAAGVAAGLARVPLRHTAAGLVAGKVCKGLVQMLLVLQTGLVEPYAAQIEAASLLSAALTVIMTLTALLRWIGG